MTKPAQGFYVHSPFCVHKCGYCDFNSWGEQRIEPQQRWLEAVLRQARYWSKTLTQDTKFDTFFWGGGTPSLVDPKLMEEFFKQIRELFCFTKDCEVTIEANPETLSQEKMALYQELGINRLSIGVQSFQDKFLERLERHARKKDNLRALDLIGKHWQGRWSLDLMFGLPEQTLNEWEEDLSLAMEFDSTHISAYQLTLTTERSKNWKQAGELGLLEFFDFTEELLAKRGFERYEVSNFAKPNQECQHNLKYWRVEPFLGIGPGAAGLLGGDQKSEHGYHQKSPDNFDVWEKQAGEEKFESLYLTPRSLKEDREEKLMMGLRLKNGISPDVLNLPEGTIESWLENPRYQGFIELNSKQNLACTPAGLKILDSLLVKLFDDIAAIAD